MNKEKKLNQEALSDEDDSSKIFVTQFFFTWYTYNCLYNVDVAVNKYQCGICATFFKRLNHLARHVHASGHGSVHVIGHPKCLTTRRAPIQRSYRFKRHILLKIDDLRKQGILNAVSHVSRQHKGLEDMKLVSKWDKIQRVKIFQRAAMRRMGYKSRFYLSRGVHHEQEVELYERFCFRRLCQRKEVARSWFKEVMTWLLRKKGVLRLGVEVSDGWLTNFLRRWRITRVCRTNIHKLSLAERMPRIQRFHRKLIYCVQRSMPRRCMKYGRFPAHRMWHTDQSPMELTYDCKHTYNPLGQPAELAVGKSTSMRICTLQLWICPDVAQIRKVKLEIIFFGTGARIYKSELDFYANLPNITIRWQRNAWCDERVFVQSLADFREATLADGEVLLGMDRHGPQRTNYCRAFMRRMRIVYMFTPSLCTDRISPVDHHVALTLKTLMRQLLLRQYSLEALMDLEMCDKRMAVAQAASESWERMIQHHSYLFRAAFVDTGFLVAMDGSENHLIELEKNGRGKYTF